MEIFSEIQKDCNYVGYHPWLGHETRELVRADFQKKFGYQPAEVLWCKPGMWMAGPLEENKPATAPTVEAGAIAEAQAVGAVELVESIAPTGPGGQIPIQLALI